MKGIYSCRMLECNFIQINTIIVKMPMLNFVFHDQGLTFNFIKDLSVFNFQPNIITPKAIEWHKIQSKTCSFLSVMNSSTFDVYNVQRVNLQPCKIQKIECWHNVISHFHYIWPKTNSFVVVPSRHVDEEMTITLVIEEGSASPSWGWASIVS
jgi:hypothetical protein